jgi:phosphoglycerate dehydrogenase-like enzyme
MYNPETRVEFEKVVDVYAPPQRSDIARTDPALLSDVEIIMSGWGAPKMDAAFLDAAPKLEAVFYGAGSIRKMVSDAFWRRGIVVSSAWAINAIPVSEYTLSQILFALKLGYQSAAAMRRERKSPKLKSETQGICGSTVGIISLGQIGRRVVELINPFDVHVIAYDPFIDAEEGQRLGVEMVSLDDLFSRSDVVSLHTPWLPETENMITGRHFASMRKNSAFINTARGAVVNESEMLEVLQRRDDLFAVLDVTYPSRPVEDSPLWTLSNVLMTPHIAGSQGRECHRHGRAMLEELKRYLAGEPLKWQVDEEKSKIMA